MAALVARMSFLVSFATSCREDSSTPGLPCASSWTSVESYLRGLRYLHANGHARLTDLRTRPRQLQSASLIPPRSTRVQGLRCIRRKTHKQRRSGRRVLATSTSTRTSSWLRTVSPFHSRTTRFTGSLELLKTTYPLTPLLHACNTTISEFKFATSPMV
jgi:hypothetical protein